VTGPATSGAAWGQAGAGRGGAGGRQGRPCSRCRPRLGRRTGPGRASGRSPRPSAWRRQTGRHSRTACRNSPCATGRQAGWRVRMSLAALPLVHGPIMDPLYPRSDLDDRTRIVAVPVPFVTERRIGAPIWMSSLRALFTWAEGNGMKASVGTVRVIDTTPSGDAFGCNTSIPAIDEWEGRALVPDRPARMPLPLPAGERGRAPTCTGRLPGAPTTISDRTSASRASPPSPASLPGQHPCERQQLVTEPETWQPMGTLADRRPAGEPADAVTS